jgi:hypothetical protein
MKMQASIAGSIAALALANPQAAIGSNSAATIEAAFSSSCRAFAARSSKDISHVELHYLDGRVVKDEAVRGPDYAVEGGAGEALELAIVKSGTTATLFECGVENRPPVARLEIATPAERSIEGCFEFFAGGLMCEQSTPRTGWTGAEQVPDTGGSDSGLLHWGCGFLTDVSQCAFTFTLRGTASEDPDGDIVAWSLDFGDGSSTGGSWDAAPPIGVAHEYGFDACRSNACLVTLTVTDSTGHNASASIRMVYVDLTPD